MVAGGTAAADSIGSEAADESPDHPSKERRVGNRTVPEQWFQKRIENQLLAGARRWDFWGGRTRAQIAARAPW